MFTKKQKNSLLDQSSDCKLLVVLHRDVWPL